MTDLDEAAGPEDGGLALLDGALLLPSKRVAEGDDAALLLPSKRVAEGDDAAQVVLRRLEAGTVVLPPTGRRHRRRRQGRVGHGLRLSVFG